jgi:hypothetical protein
MKKTKGLRLRLGAFSSLRLEAPDRLLTLWPVLVVVVACWQGHGWGFDDADVCVAAGSGDSSAFGDAGAWGAGDGGVVAACDLGEVAEGLQDEFLVGGCFAGAVDDGPDGAEGVRGHGWWGWFLAGAHRCPLSFMMFRMAVLLVGSR